MPFLEIEPKSEIKFRATAGAFKDVVTSEIIATNISMKTVCFKVKTTAPKQYCVRPNCAYIEAGQSMVIYIMLQPIELSALDKPKHKFLIQSLEMTPPLPENPELVWKSADPEEIGEHKLKCVFELENYIEDKNDKKIQQVDKKPLQADKRLHPVDPNRKQVAQPTRNIVSLVTGLVVGIVSIIVGVIVGKYLIN